MTSLKLAKRVALKVATQRREHIYKDPAGILDRMTQYGEEPKNPVYLFTNAFMEAFQANRLPEYAQEEDAEMIAWTEKDAYERFIDNHVRNSSGGVFPQDYPDSQSFFYVLRSAINKLPRNVHASLPNGKIDNSLKNRINDSLRKAGFDGNGRFRSVGAGLNSLSGVLEDHGLEPDQVFSSYTFGKPSGNEPVHLAFKHPTDPFSPIPVTNRMISLSWTELSPDQFEYLAYVT